jgi:hypothetical protein
MALAIGTATFTATDTAAFVWVPALVTNPPQVYTCCVTTTDGTVQAASVQGTPTNIGGTVNTLGPMTGTVVLIASG